jgi:hypothetical protein
MKLPRISSPSASAAASPADAPTEATDVQRPEVTAADPAAPSARAGRLDAGPLAPRAPLDASGSATPAATLPHVVSRPLDAAALTALIARTIGPTDADTLAPDAMVRAMNALVPRAGDALRARIVAQQRHAMSPAGSTGPWLDAHWWKAGATVSVPRLDALQQAARQPHASATAASNALHQVLEHHSIKASLFQVRTPLASTAQRMRVASAGQFVQRFDAPAHERFHEHLHEHSPEHRADTAPASAGAPTTLARHDAMRAAARVVANVTGSAGMHVAHAPWLEALSHIGRVNG